MEPMTPEERWIRIENAMQYLMEAQAEAQSRHAEAQARHAEAQARHDADLAKNEAAIRDLIVVSRIFLDSQKQLTIQVQSHDEEMAQFREGMEELRQVQNAMSEKLHALIDTVDRIIRNSNK